MNIQRVLCCVDFSTNADRAFIAALDVAEKFNAQLHLLHVLPPVINPLITDIDIAIPEESSQTLLHNIEMQMDEVYGKRVQDETSCCVVVKDGHISTEILNYLMDEKIDLVILGAYGLAGVELVIFGSVAKRVAHKAPCSVMIVREESNSS